MEWIVLVVGIVAGIAGLIKWLDHGSYDPAIDAWHPADVVRELDR